MHKSQINSFRKKTEADRKLFVAELYHQMWYDESFFHKINSAKIEQDSKPMKKPVFYPIQNN